MFNDFNPNDMSREEVKQKIQQAAQKARNGEPLTPEDAEWLFSYAAALELRTALLSMQLTMATAVLESTIGHGGPSGFSDGLNIKFEN